MANVRFYAFFQHFYAGSGLVLPSTAQVVRSNRPPRAEAYGGFVAVLKAFTLRKEKEALEEECFDGRRQLQGFHF